MQKNVLLIESDTSFARAMSAALELRGYGVRTSPDGKEGFELARALHPDCVVLCVELPGLSGYSWCNRLKKDGSLKSIPLVITSSEATPETFDQHRKLKTRAEDYLLKPFQPETLVERVGALVGLPETSGEDEELVTLEDVELEGAPAEGAPPSAEDDVDLKMLDDAFDNISRGGDEPSAHAPGAPASEPPLTLMPEADESPALSGFDRDMAAALASLAEEAAEASKAPPLTHPAAPDPFRAVPPPPPPQPPRRTTARVESPAQEETPVLLEEVEVLAGVDEDGASALQAAREEAAALRAETDEARRLLALRETEATALLGKLHAATEQSARGQELLARAQERSTEQEGELAAVRSKLSAAELSATERGAELVDAERRAEGLEREIEVARTEAEGLRAEVESLRSSADGVRGEAAGLRNEVATLGATVDGLRSEIEALRSQSDLLRSEAGGLRAELESVRADLGARSAEVESLRAERESLRAGGESLRAEAAALRGEVEGHRESADAFRAEAEGRATELSLRIQELEGQAAQGENRLLRAYQKIKSDEKIREKTRKALAMVLQILEERPGGDGGSPPAAS